MGNLFSHLFEKLVGKTEKRIVMIGLDAAGKTTILYNLKLGEIVTTVPTIGFNVEKVSYKNIDFNVWDIGGQDKIRKLWNYYYSNCDAVIFVIDSNDEERLDGRSSDCMDVSNAKEELYKTLEADELRNAVLLVFANKQDLPNALSVNEISQRLELPKLRHEWRIQPCCGTRGDGLFEGLDWLVSVLSKKKSY